MSQPTTSVFFSASTPAPPTGDQNTVPQSDGAQPQQKVSQYPKRATGALFGTVKPDGTTIVIAGGVISAVATPSTWIEEVPAGAMNGSNKVFTLSETPTAGSLTLVLNVPQVEGTDFTISGNTITYTFAPKASDTGWHQARYQD